MRTFIIMALGVVMLLIGQTSKAQSLFFDFNGADTYAPNFFQDSDLPQPLIFSYSSMGGVNDNAGAPGGGVLLSPGGVVSANVLVTLYNTPPSFSLDSASAYTISEYVQISNLTDLNTILVALVFHNGLVTHDTALVAAALVNTPAGVVAAVQSKSVGVPTQNEQATPLSIQPLVGDWIKLTFALRETNVNTGTFVYGYEVKDYGQTGLDAPVTLLAATFLGFTNSGLAGNATANWTVGWASNLGGEHFDNFKARVQPLTLTTAVSRKTHGGAGDFDVNLPLVGEPGVECRNSGGNHTLILTFSNGVVSGSATVTTGIGTVSGSPTFADNTMTMSLTGVADVQKITVTLSGVTDVLSQILPDTAVSMNVLIGDTNGNKSITASDVAQTKAQSGATVTAANFRTDINASGTLTASDVAQVKANAGHTLP